MPNAPHTPPSAKTVPFSFEHLGRTFSDPYAWLQNKQDPAVIEYLEAENAYGHASLAHTLNLYLLTTFHMKGKFW